MRKRIPFFAKEAIIVVPPFNIYRNVHSKLIVPGAYVVGEAARQAGLPVRLLDFQNDPTLTLSVLLRGVGSETLLGICATVGSYSWIRELVIYLDENLPASDRPLVVAGGSLATSNAEELLELGVDVVLRGEVDTTLAQFLRSLENGELEKVPGIVYLDEAGRRVAMPIQMPKPKDFQTMNVELLKNLEPIYDLPIQLTRGCPFNCDSCGGMPDLVGKRVRRMEEEQVKRALGHLKNSVRFEMLNMTDNDCLLNAIWMRKVADVLDALGIRWMATLKANYSKVAYHLPYLAAKKLVGVDFDIESIHPTIHKMNNLFGFRLLTSDYQRAVRIAQGVLGCADVSFVIKTGWRDEGMKELYEVKEFILALQEPVSRKEAEALALGVWFVSDTQKEAYITRLAGEMGELRARYWDIRPVGYPGSPKSKVAIEKGRKLGYLPFDMKEAIHKYLELVGWYLCNRFAYDDERWFMVLDMCNHGKVPTGVLAETIQSLDMVIHKIEDL